jgi:hypothetical protein
MLENAAAVRCPVVGDSPGSTLTSSTLARVDSTGIDSTGSDFPGVDFPAGLGTASQARQIESVQRFLGFLRTEYRSTPNPRATHQLNRT